MKNMGEGCFLCWLGLSAGAAIYWFGFTDAGWKEVATASWHYGTALATVYWILRREQQ